VNRPSDWLMIYGAGGHGRVVDSIIRACPPHYFPRLIFFVDDRWSGVREPALAAQIYGRDIYGKIPWRGSGSYVMAIGDNATRVRIGRQLIIGLGQKPMTISHPSASVADDAEVRDGVVICAQAHIGPGSVIQDHVIINTGAVVEHDCHVGTGSHIAGGAVLCGGVRVGHECLIGANATILPGVKLGDRVIVGAGSVITQGCVVEDDTVLMGVPARANHRPDPSTAKV